MRNLGTGAQIKLAVVKAEKKGNHYLVSIHALVLCLGVSGQIPDLNVGEHIFLLPWVLIWLNTAMPGSSYSQTQVKQSY